MRMPVYHVTRPPTIGQHVRKARQEAGWTQCHVAKLTGLTRSYVGKIETGKSTPSLRTLTALADALGCTSAQLLAGV